MRKWILLLMLFVGTEIQAGPGSIWWFVPKDTARLSYWMEKVKLSGGTIRFRSEWMPVFSAEIDKRRLKSFSADSVAVYPVLHLEKAGLSGFSKTEYSRAIDQMQGKAFERAGLSGLGVTIGITDAGYLFLDDSTHFYSLTHLWKGKQIVACKDYCKGADTMQYDECYYTGRPEPYRRRKNSYSRMLYEFRTAYHRHGADVLNAIAGKNDKTGVQTGLAPDASFYLTRTDFGYSEHIDEEDYYVRALEWLAGKGVRLINTSLGYTRGRKVKSQNYTPYQMNGSSILANAVDIATNKKNILVVVAAGNEGQKSNWRVVATPGDAPAALTVGAYDYGYMKAGYSSIGPDFISYLKPEVAAFSLDGTSFSTPAVCGFAACLLEKKPDLTAVELKTLIMKSGILYPYGNNYVGYGVPLATRALALLDNPDTVFNTAREVKVSGDYFKFENPGNAIPYLTVYHKYSSRLVYRQEIARPHPSVPNVIVVKKPLGCNFTTIQAGYRVIEIVWQEE